MRKAQAGKTGDTCRCGQPGSLPNVFGPMNGQNGGPRVSGGNAGGGKKGKKHKRKKGGY